MHKKTLHGQAATSAQWYCTIFSDLVLLGSLCELSKRDLFDLFLKILKSVWIRLRLSRSGFIRPAGSSLTSPLYGATRIFRPRPTERAENAYGLRTTPPIPSVHESFDLLSKAFTRRWGLLRFGALWLWNLLRCMYWVPMLPRLSRMKSAWWALTNKHPRHSLKHWSFSTGGLKLHKHSVFQKDRGISSSCAIAVSRNLGTNCRRWFEPNRSKQCIVLKVPLLERSLAKHDICFFMFFNSGALIVARVSSPIQDTSSWLTVKKRQRVNGFYSPSISD